MTKWVRGMAKWAAAVADWVRGVTKWVGGMAKCLRGVTNEGWFVIPGRLGGRIVGGEEEEGAPRRTLRTRREEGRKVGCNL